MNTGVTMFGAVGAGVGALQTPLIREYIDKKYAAPFPSLGGYGTYSALAGVGGGSLALVGGLYGMKSRKLSDKAVEALVDYGTVALVSGIISGALPIAPPAAAFVPAIRYAGEMETIQRLSQEIQRLSAENAAIRAQVQTQSTARAMSGGGTITSMQPMMHSRQQQYGFMSPRGPLAPSLQQSGPGRATPAARNFGFMADDNMSLAKMQTMKSYGFLG